MADKGYIINNLHEILKNICHLEFAFGNNQVLSSRSKISNNIHEVTSEINRLYHTNFQGVLLRSMTVNQIADEIIKKMGDEKSSSQSSGSASSSQQSKKMDDKGYIINVLQKILKNICHLKTRRLNIVVVGRSGVGKSSFLNYAAGKKVFETGMGDPVTQSYFDVIDVNIPQKNVIYSLYDTKGLEAGNTEEWKKAIYSEIERRDESDNIYDWFHTIIYCIDASSKRIQPFEINAVKELAEQGSVLVLLTKKDLVTPDILDSLKKQLLSEVGDKVQVLSVCSVSTRTRKGESKASGLEDVLRVSFLGLWEKAAKMLPLRAINDFVCVNQTLEVNKDLANLCAVATLTCNEQRKVIVSGRDIAEIVESDYYTLIDKDIPYLHFKKVGDLSDTKIVRAGDKVQVDIRDWHFPSLVTLPSHLDHDLLDARYYREGVRTYLRLVNETFTHFVNQMRNGNISEIRSRVGKNGTIIGEILKFYNDVNGTNQKPLFNHKTDKAISALDRFNYEKNLENFENHVSKVESALSEVAACLFSSGSERRSAEEKYSEFQGWFNKVIIEFDGLVQNFITSYEAELHSYGQYCIREDEFAGRKNEEYAENKELSQLKNLIKAALSDGVIRPKERMMLESMAEMYEINRENLDKLITEVSKNA